MASLTLDEEIRVAEKSLKDCQAQYTRTGGFQDSLPVLYWTSKLDTLLKQKQAIISNYAQQQAPNAFAQQYQNYQNQQYGQGFTVSSVMPISWFNQMYGQSIPTPPNDNATTLQPTWEELLEVKVINFGKYAGQEMSQIPDDYIHWLIDTRKKDIKEYEKELERRSLVESANVSITEAIIKAGYRELAKNLHPDKGGDPAKFQELTAANEQLKMVLAELKNVKGTTA